MNKLIENGNMNPTFWAVLRRIDGDAMQKWTYEKGDVPIKKYALLFNLFTKNSRTSFSISEYDNYDECLSECNELDTIYAHHVLPEEIREIKENKRGSDTIIVQYDFSNNKSWWGYIVLDFVNCRIKKIGGHGFYIGKCLENKYSSEKLIINKMKVANTSYIRDYFFRNIDEVPDNYKWDDGEYKGWLQFKWGDGKNAVDYIEPPKPKKEKVEPIEYDIENHGLDDPFEFDKDYENELMEEKFADLLTKETRKQLMDKFGW